MTTNRRPRYALWLAALPVLWLMAGAAMGAVSSQGMLVGGAFLLWLASHERIPAVLWRSVALLLSLALGAHWLPGFVPLPLSDALVYSPDAKPVLLRLSWDKVLVGLGLLVWWVQQPRDTAAHWPAVAKVSVLTLLMVPAVAWALNLVGWQPKWPPQFGLWLALNLFGAVLAEELVFRGLLQTWLVQRMGALAGIGITALLFGAVHAPFSPMFAVVAGLAGLGYGAAFHLSGRLWPAMALHLAVNVCHVLLLTYPLRLA